MRNYRELTTKEVEQLRELYPVTTNRELARMFDISLDSIQDRFAKPLGWKKDRNAVQIGSRGGKSLTEEQIQWIIKHYKHTKNRDILQRFDIGESQLHRVARKYGLSKSKQFSRKVQRENAEIGYAVCEEYGVYEQNAEYAREQWRLRKERGERCGFKPGESNKDRMSPSKYKAMMERTHEKRRETIRKERMRIRWGMEQKTKVKLVHNRGRTCYRHLLKRKGYLVERGSRKVYFDDSTQRSAVMERRASTYGLTVLPAV